MISQRNIGFTHVSRNEINSSSTQNCFVVCSWLVRIQSREWHVSESRLATRMSLRLDRQRCSISGARHTGMITRSSDRCGVAREKLEIVCSRSFLSYLGSESLAQRRPTRCSDTHPNGWDTVVLSNFGFE